MTLTFGLTAKLGLAGPLAFMLPHSPPPPPVAVVAAAPVLRARVVAPVTSSTTVPAQPGPQPVGPSVTVTATDCTVSWTTTQTNPVNGQSGPYTGTFYGDCGVAQQLANEFGGTVTQTAPFTYTTGTGN